MMAVSGWQLWWCSGFVVHLKVTVVGERSRAAVDHTKENYFWSHTLRLYEILQNLIKHTQIFVDYVTDLLILKNNV